MTALTDFFASPNNMEGWSRKNSGSRCPPIPTRSTSEYGSKHTAYRQRGVRVLGAQMGDSFR